MQKKKRVIAIGETGLDYYHMFGGDKTAQIELMLKHLEIAKHLDLPVIIHNRNAGEDLLPILEEKKLPPKGGILHCFGEDWTFARRALDMNLTFSFAGNLTFKNSRMLQEVAMRLPEDRIVIESEAPFMTPYSHKGERNKIQYILETANVLAALRQTSLEALSQTLYANSLRLLPFRRIYERKEPLSPCNDRLGNTRRKLVSCPTCRIHRYSIQNTLH